MEKLDDIDIQILKELQRNAKLTVKELADKVHLSSNVRSVWSEKDILRTTWPS